MRLLAGLVMLVLFFSGCIVSIDPRSLDETPFDALTPSTPSTNENTNTTPPAVVTLPAGNNGDTNTTTPSSPTINPPTQTVEPPVTTPATITLSASEIAKHSTKKNCWVIYSGSVYDISSYTSHPGGNVYVPYCGKDMTKAYDRQGHSGKADAILGNFILGKVGASIPA